MNVPVFLPNHSPLQDRTVKVSHICFEIDAEVYESFSTEKPLPAWTPCSSAPDNTNAARAGLAT